MAMLEAMATIKTSIEIEVSIEFVYAIQLYTIPAINNPAPTTPIAIRIILDPSALRPLTLVKNAEPNMTSAMINPRSRIDTAEAMSIPAVRIFSAANLDLGLKIPL